VEQTRTNKNLIEAYFNAAVFGGQRDRIPVYRYVEDFHQHNCTAGDIKDGVPAKGSNTPPSRSRESTRSWVREISYWL
jgi:hypothetical protein